MSRELVDAEGGGHGGLGAGLEFGFQGFVILVAERAAALGVAA